MYNKEEQGGKNHHCHIIAPLLLIQFIKILISYINSTVIYISNINTNNNIMDSILFY